jgi:hypothetical protein
VSEATFKRAFDEAFFAAWADGVEDLDAVYTSPDAVATPVQVLVDTGVEQFGDDSAPVSAESTFITFRRAQIEPATGGTVVVGGVTYTLAQRVSRSDESLSRWAVQS